MSLTTETRTEDGMRHVTHESTFSEVAKKAMQLEPALRAFGQEHGVEDTLMALAFWLGSSLGASGAVVDFGNPPEGSVPDLAKVFYDSLRKNGAH